MRRSYACRQPKLNGVDLQAASQPRRCFPAHHYHGLLHAFDVVAVALRHHNILHHSCRAPSLPLSVTSPLSWPTVHLFRRCRHGSAPTAVNAVNAPHFWLYGRRLPALPSWMWRLKPLALLPAVSVVNAAPRPPLSLWMRLRRPLTTYAVVDAICSPPFTTHPNLRCRGQHDMGLMLLCPMGSITIDAVDGR